MENMQSNAKAAAWMMGWLALMMVTAVAVRPRAS